MQNCNATAHDVHSAPVKPQTFCPTFQPDPAGASATVPAMSQPSVCGISSNGFSMPKPMDNSMTSTGLSAAQCTCKYYDLFEERWMNCHEFAQRRFPHKVWAAQMICCCAKNGPQCGARGTHDLSG